MRELVEGLLEGFGEGIERGWRIGKWNCVFVIDIDCDDPIGTHGACGVDGEWVGETAIDIEFILIGEWRKEARDGDGGANGGEQVTLRKNGCLSRG